MLRLVCTFVYLVYLVVPLLTTKGTKDTKEMLRLLCTFVYLVYLVVLLLTTKDTVYITMRRMPSFRCGTLKLMMKPNLRPVALR